MDSNREPTKLQDDWGVCAQGYQTLKHYFVMAITRKRSLSILQNGLQLDDKMIVSTSDDVLSSRNHKHHITTVMQIQTCSFVCVTLCKMVITGSWYAQQTHMSLCRCRAVGCYGYRNAVVLYPSPLSVFQSRAGSKQGTNIFYTFPGVIPPFVLVKE